MGGLGEGEGKLGFKIYMWSKVDLNYVTWMP